MIFQYQYKRLGTLYSVDHYAGSNPEALDFCGTTVYPELAWFAFRDYLTDADYITFDGVEFVDLDRS